MITQLHIQSGNGSLNGFAADSLTILSESSVAAILLSKFLKFNASQAFATQYPRKKCMLSPWHRIY